MKIKRRRVTTIETRSVIVVRAGTSTGHLCSDCAAESWLVPLDQAAALTGTSAGELQRRIEAKTIHFGETPTGEILICLNS